MILPTKRLSQDRCLLKIGADILVFLEEPKTVSRLWNLVKAQRLKFGSNDILNFDWFVLALDMLFAANLINFQDGLVLRVTV